MSAPNRAAIERGHDLERAVMRALGVRPDAVVMRNPKGIATTRSGVQVSLGIGGDGAPDLLVEVRLPSGLWAALWLECKSGAFARLRKDQREWFAAALLRGRLAFVVRSVEHAVEIVDAVARGERPSEPEVQS